MHPVDELRGKKSTKLFRKRIVLGITGSIAAVESVRLARELIRHGAEVYPVMTPASTRILHPDALEFATGHSPVVVLSGKIEHVAWCGLVQHPVDLLLISPCTANTISKIALGIDDTPVTTCATTAIGSGVPVLIVPSMHLSMYDHAIVQQNIGTLRDHGVMVMDPLIEGSKAKLPEIDHITETVIRAIGRQDLVHKKVLIIGGATSEPIDDIRVLSNRSSGKTAISLAVNAFERGAEVELWYGSATETVPSFIPVKRYRTVADLLRMIRGLKGVDCLILCAAIANYIPKQQKGKIPSGKDGLSIALSKAPVVLEALRARLPDTQLIAFKAEEKKANVKRKTAQLLKRHGLDGAVGNTITGFGREDNEVLLLYRNGKSVWKRGKKEMLASEILNMLT
jgi:phosphopantothenoylcysteine decarboxylase/phosphopantothenate--cysteine ligase